MSKFMTDQPVYPTLLGHMDTLLRYYEAELAQPSPAGLPPEELPFVKTFFARNDEGHIDFLRAQEGAMAGAFFATFVPAPPCDEGDICRGFVDAQEELRDPHWYDRYTQPSVAHDYALNAALHFSSLLARLEAGAQGRLKIVRTLADLEDCLRRSVLAAIMHIEGAEMIDPQLHALDVFYQAGLRSLGPVWSRPNAFGYGVPFVFGHSPDIGPGLTGAGKALVRACNRLGIMLDLSHLNEQGFWDVERLSDAPLVATHSNAYTVCPSSRNLTDKQLDAIKASDGLVGVNFSVYDIQPDGHGSADTPLEDLVQHVEYLVQRIGIERVVIGSDYDGATMPRELCDVSKLPLLYAALAQRGFNEHELRMIAHENWLRLLRQTWHE